MFYSSTLHQSALKYLPSKFLPSSITASAQAPNVENFILDSPVPTAFANLQSEIDLNSTWTPSIIVDIQPAFATDNTKETDLVKYLEKPTALRLLQLEHLNYPLGTSFCFTPFEGLDDKDKLTNYIKQAAIQTSGTALTIGNSQPYNGGAIAYMIRLECKFHRASRTKGTTFSDNNLQQTGTIIQKAHQSCSVKQKPRSSTQQRVTTTTSGNLKVAKLNTNRRLSSEHICSFGITMVLSRKTSNGTCIIVDIKIQNVHCTIAIIYLLTHFMFQFQYQIWMTKSNNSLKIPLIVMYQ